MNRLLKTLIAGISALTMCISVMPLSVNATSITYIRGDVNGDGTLNTKDLLLAKKYLNGTGSLSKEALIRMDVINDYVLDNSDTSKLQRVLLGLDTLNTNNATAPVCDDVNNESRQYIKYNLSTKKTSTYTLSSLEVMNDISTTYLSVDDDNILDNKNLNTIKIEYPNGGYGSGFIVDSHVIATAAHCVYDTNNKKFVSSLTVNIYNSDGKTIAKTVTPKSCHIPTGYKNYADNGCANDDDNKYDYALIYVDEDLSSYGCWNLGTATSHFMTSSKNVTSSGFTIDGRRYYSTGKILNVAKTDVSNNNNRNNQVAYRIVCEANASGGKSGGPMYYTSTYNGVTSKTVIGITTGGSEHTWGVRITPTILNFYKNNDYLVG